LKKRILVILGHPDKSSFCGALASAYIEGAEESGAEVKRINIGDLNFDPNLRKGYKVNQKLELDLVKAQGQIKWADHIVWFFPVWWSLYPAIMKGFIDRIYVPGFAFKFVKGKILWERYLTGKSCRFIVTMDNIMFYYIILMSPGTKSLWALAILSGIRPLRKLYFGNIRKKLEQYLNRVKKLGLKQK
jgi:putative NADPH-quinone reductase